MSARKRLESRNGLAAKTQEIDREAIRIMETRGIAFSEAFREALDALEARKDAEAIRMPRTQPGGS